MSEQDKNFNYWTQSDSGHDDLEEIVHDPEGEIWKDELIVDQATTLGCLLSMHPPSINDVDGIACRLSVVGARFSSIQGDWWLSSIYNISSSR